MQIQYYGLSCFKIVTRPGGRATDEVSIYINGLENREGLRSVYGSADILLNSHSIKDKSGITQFKGEPVYFDCPGEYSVKGVNMISMYSSDNANTMHLLETEDIKIIHLGELNSPLNEAQYEFIDGADILCIPVGGNLVLDAPSAASVIRKIEPAIVLPMCYKIENSQAQLEGIEKVYREFGSSPGEIQSKLTLKKKDLEGKSMKIVQLESLR